MRRVLLLALLATAWRHPARADEAEAPPAAAGLEAELAGRGAATDTDALIRLASAEGDTAPRWTAIELLGLRRASASAEALRRIVTADPDRLLRETAALALARLGDPAGVPALERLLLEAATPGRRLFLAARLAELGRPTGYAPVKAALAAPEARLRFLALSALVPFLGFPAPVDAAAQLVERVDDADPTVRAEAMLHVVLAAGQGHDLDEGRRRIERRAVGDPDPLVRERARLMLLSLRAVRPAAEASAP
jgi:HEAT repeat protein